MSLDQFVVREALTKLPSVASQESLTAPDISSIHVPRLHPKALGLDTSIVVGMRGAGKSWWTAVLADKNTRRVAARGLGDDVEVRVGFGLDESNVHFPSPDSIARMRGSFSPKDIWWTVVLHHASDIASLRPPGYPAEWVARGQHWLPRREQVLTACDDALAGSGRKLLILLDALDRVSNENDWGQVRDMTTAALEVCLALRSRRAIRFKLFLRPDLDEDERIWRFQDSSKLKQGKFELHWQVADLYAMLFARLANESTYGSRVAEWLASLPDLHVTHNDGVVSVGAVADENLQRQMMEAIASPYMGTNSKRGFTYRWIPLHLADAAGRVSPRSWLIAFRSAAEQTASTHATFARALHYKGIQQGVVEASEVRVREIAEDHPWVGALLGAARDLQVPCRPEELLTRWTPEVLRDKESSGRLPPLRYTTDPSRAGQLSTLIDDLRDLGILYRTADGERINIPDIFRVKFGIKRKGGVKPPR